jgi:predicted naringenin-chalcone synthase
MAQRLAHRVYAASGIENRYSAIPDVLEPTTETPFFNRTEKGEITLPTTKFRNDWYIQESRSLFVDVAQKALDDSIFEKEQITHVITVSCTGFYAPGPDYYIVKDLGLSTSVQRYHIGFMGCYAAFTALRMANTICEADEHAVVLLADLELCSIHLQFKEETDSIIAGSVFADGAAGVVLSAKKPVKGFSIIGLQTALTQQGEQDMAWTIGDNGFDMVLSSYVPKIIGAELSDVINPYLKKYNVAKDELSVWAIHPGGKAVLEKCEQALGLTKQQLSDSYAVFSHYGNMSSVTILFILQRILQQKESFVFPAMAFGPGLTVEFGLFKKLC